MFNERQTNKLEWSLNGERLQIIPWGHGLRVCDSFFEIENNWALTESAGKQKDFKIAYKDDKATITNGGIMAVVDKNGKIIFYDRNGKVLLEEFRRFRQKEPESVVGNTFVNANMLNNYVSALKISGRELRPVIGGDYQAYVRFEPNDKEKLFGMGQYQQKQLDLKGCHLELAHRNSQASVPFVLSNQGYGMLWNNPSIGEVTFAQNITEWFAGDTKIIDYWICAGDSPKSILKKYTEVTGRAPMMPESGLGLWQSKLRYRSQDEVVNIAKRYHDENIPLSVVVIDYFHWPNQGDYKFDKKYFPNPQKMVLDLKKMGIDVMVSVWPNIDKKSENYQAMLSRGLLVKADRGTGLTMLFQGNTTFFDVTNVKAREYVWSKIKDNYYDIGIRSFWLDEAEPEYSPYDFDIYRLNLGRNTQIGNVYPELYAKGFYQGMKNAGQKDVINLVRSAWAGSQKYGTLVWTGDIDSSFRSFRYQYQAGLNMGMAGIPWWTSDIGGFHGGSAKDPEFVELMIRWFEFATFCPVLRMHGDREPHTLPLTGQGGGKVGTGAPNELWSYGEKAFNIFKGFVALRDELKPYLRQCMRSAHLEGYPVMRTLFFNYPHDSNAWNIEDEHMLGDDLLIAPIFEYGRRQREVYLPSGDNWIGGGTKRHYQGGQRYTIQAPLNEIPIFVREK